MDSTQGLCCQTGPISAAPFTSLSFGNCQGPCQVNTSIRMMKLRLYKYLNSLTLNSLDLTGTYVPLLWLQTRFYDKSNKLLHLRNKLQSCQAIIQSKMEAESSSNIFKSPVADIVIPEKDLYNFLFESISNEDQNKVALVCSDTSLTYSQLRLKIEQVSWKIGFLNRLKIIIEVKIRLEITSGDCGLC